MTHTLIVMMKGNSVIVQPNRKSQGSIYIPRHLCSRSHSWFLFWNIRVSVTLTLQHDPSCLHSTCKPTWVSQEKEKFPAPSLSCSSLLFSESVYTIGTSSLSIHYPLESSTTTILWRVWGRASPGPLRQCLLTFPIPSFLAFCLQTGHCWKQVHLMNNCFINNEKKWISKMD